MTEHPSPTPDPSDCPICGDWRDSPTADCANCGWSIRRCGDVLGLCAYRGPHEGPHKISGSWKDRLAALADSATGPLDVDLLEEAFWFVLSKDPLGGHVTGGDIRRLIPQIAAEYTRLASQSSEATDDGGDE